jgi:Ser/Thr protein kinase RdoA (MazF antagonist)
MEKNITDRYSEDILIQSLEKFSISQEDVEALGGFESYIFRVTRGEEEGIIRIAHDLRRTPDQIRGELDWINYLANNGVGVTRPWKSDQGEWVELIEDGKGGNFLVSGFDQAPGKNFRGPDWPEKLLWNYGKLLGSMHFLSTTYQPSNPAWKRPQWDDPIHLDVSQFIPEDDQKIKDLYQEIISITKKLPKDQGTYGLIHQDAHQGNFFVDDSGQITLFDFDDSSYSWFVEDIALVLFYAVMGQKNPAEFTRQFLAGFLPGYFEAFSLDLNWFNKIPLFMKRREIDLYAVIHRSFDVENLDDAWCIWYLDGRKDRLERGEPYLNFDFESFEFENFLP